MYKPDFKNINVGGIPTACVGREELALLIGDVIEHFHTYSGDKSEPFIIFSNNGHAISIFNSDKSARDEMLKADLIHADGQSVVTFSKWFDKVGIPERTATTDMIHDVPNYYKKSVKHFLLGGKEESVSGAAKIMSEKYSNFDVVGHQHGYFSAEDEDRICDEINSAKPDILWVGLGKPKEQIFCIRNKEKLNVPVIISCGGCYNYITGEYSRAPMWMQKYGLEWLYRMASDPKKLFWRYLVTNPHAIYCVVSNRKK